MTTVYLAGPINGCDDDGAHGWREDFKQSASGCFFFDPMDRDYRGREDECVDEIVEGDMDDIDKSDIVVANCWQVSWGTAMELHYAHTRWPKPYIIVVMPKGQRISPWLRYHSDEILATLSETADRVQVVSRFYADRAREMKYIDDDFHRCNPDTPEVCERYSGHRPTFPIVTT